MPRPRSTTAPQVETWGVYDPGKGFLVGRSELGELGISGYGMVRYMSQHDADQKFTDHLGNVRAVDPRDDIFSHRIMVFLKGWMGSEKLIYNITLWTVNTTDQDAMFANIGYQFSRKFSLYAGLTGNPGSRSLSGSHPFWLAHDRVMADEFFRPFFGSGIYATGEVVPGLWYTAAVSNNSSSLGTKASQLDRKYTYGGTVWWMPTTHEFGPRGAYGDWEWHEELATRFGMSYVESPEQSFRNTSGNPGQHHAAARRQRERVRDRRAGTRGHGRERRLPRARGRCRRQVQGCLPAGRVLPALARQLRCRRVVAGR